MVNRNNFKIFVRNLNKQKTVGLLSIGSLAIAIAVVILIGLWAINEFSFDHFHKDKDQMYRVYGTLLMNNEKTSLGAAYKPLGPDAVRRFPEISAMCRVVDQNMEVKIHDVLYPDNKVFLCDSNFFSFFTFALKSGDPVSCLSTPDGIIIDEMTAKRFFPESNPLEQSLTVGGKEFTVKAIMENMPANSHLRANIVMPFFNYWKENLQYGSSDCFMTYFKIPDATALSKIEEGMTEGIRTFSNQFKQLGFEYKLQPLNDIHFNTSFKFDDVVHGNKSLVLIFVLTAFVILLIACINFINLFVSTSFLRAKSIGVKKTHGAERSMLVKEFYTETFYYVLFSVLIGLLIAFLALPVFNRLADYNLKIDFLNPLLYLFLIGVTVFVMFIAGTFPALYMTKFNTVATLKGQFKGKNLSFLQKGLIIAQFTAAIVILIVVFFIDKQVNFMINKDLGFNKENVVYVYDRGGFTKSYKAFCQDMKNYPVITDVSMKNGAPTDWTQGNSVRKPGDSQEYLMEFCQIEPNYFDLMSMKMACGQVFPEKMNDSLHYCIVNETSARMLGLTEPVGEKLYVDDTDYTIVGVVKDAQTKSLHHRVDPQIYFPFAYRSSGTVFFKIQGNPQEAIRLIQTKWNELNPGIPFEYYFLDDTYAQLYKSETNAGNILSTAMGITLLISIAGLFAMAYYTTQRRLKEVGVRKVNGASVPELLFILNRDFFVWVGISFILACPVAYVFVIRWLEGFTERTDISLWVFAVVGIITFLITFLTVSYLTWKAANVNPVKVLKSE